MRDIVGSIPISKCSTTFSNGCLGSRIDEERSEMWYVMRIAKLCESLKFWTHIALAGFFLEAYMSECQQTLLSAFVSHYNFVHLPSFLWMDGVWHVYVEVTMVVGILCWLILCRPGPVLLALVWVRSGQGLVGSEWALHRNISRWFQSRLWSLVTSISVYFVSTFCMKIVVAKCWYDYFFVVSLYWLEKLR